VTIAKIMLVGRNANVNPEIPIPEIGGESRRLRRLDRRRRGADGGCELTKKERTGRADPRPFDLSNPKFSFP